MRLCAVAGCPTLTGETYCTEHQRQRRRASDRKRPSAAERGYDAKWRKTRKDHLCLSPLCVECGAEATEVDHIDGLGPNGPLGHEHGNLRSLCRSCHGRRTARDQPGGWHATV